MEKIIKKAIEGGYRGESIWQNPVSETWHFNDEYDLRIPCLDPQFFQALGKACGWVKSSRMIIYKLPRMIEENLETDNPELEIEEYYALRFHEENLVNGWESAVNLLSNMVNLTHEEKM